MNILFFSHYPSLYGANRSLINLIQGLKSKNINSFVIIPEKGSLTEWLEKENIPYQIIDFELSTQAVPKESSFFKKLRTNQYVKRQAVKRLFKNIKACKKILHLIKEWNIDILYSNSSVISIAWWLKMITKKKYVLHIRELREAHYGFQPDWGNYLFQKHINDTDLTIAVSYCVKKYYNLQHANVIYNGVFFKNEIKKNDTTPTLHAPYTFGIIGVIHPNKGQIQVLNAFIEFLNLGYNAKLLIAGNGNTNEIQKIIEQHNVSDYVILLGHINNPMDFFKKIDTSIICSKYEAMGRVTIESMLMKVPILGLNHSGTKELIINQKTGFLFEDNQQSLVNSMKNVIELEDNSKKIIVQNAFHYAQNNFTIEHYTNQIADLLTPLVQR